MKFKYHFDSFKFSDNRKSITKKIIVSIFAIIASFLLGIIIASIIYASQPSIDPFQIIAKIFTAPFESINNINSLFSSMAIYGVAALSFIFAFKSGLFNIGISGQMMAAGVVAIITAQLLGEMVPTILGQIVMLLIGLAIGMFVGMLIGFLKAQLNVNEVISSIMFNWIIYFVGTWMLTKFCTADSGGTYTDPGHFSSNFALSIGGQSFIPLLIIFIILVIFTAVSLTYSVYGKKIINTGMSITASQAAGYKTKKNQILAMAISGALAGIMGIMVYCGRENGAMYITVSAKTIPVEGFNGISVGLIAMNNPIATVPIAFLFGMVESSKASISGLGIDGQITNLIFGIIVYGAAAIALFYWFKPWLWLIRLFKGKEYLKNYKDYVINVQNELQDTSDALNYLRIQYKAFKQENKKKEHKKEIRGDDEIYFSSYKQRYLVNNYKLKNNIIYFFKYQIPRSFYYFTRFFTFKKHLSYEEYLINKKPKDVKSNNYQLNSFAMKTISNKSTVKDYNNLPSNNINLNKIKSKADYKKNKNYLYNLYFSIKKDLHDQFISKVLTEKKENARSLNQEKRIVQKSKEFNEKAAIKSEKIFHKNQAKQTKKLDKKISKVRNNRKKVSKLEKKNIKKKSKNKKTADGIVRKSGD